MRGKGRGDRDDRVRRRLNDALAFPVAGDVLAVPDVPSPPDETRGALGAEDGDVGNLVVEAKRCQVGAVLKEVRGDAVPAATVRVLEDPGYQASRHLDRGDGVVHLARAEESVFTDLEEDPGSAEVGVLVDSDIVHN